MDYFGARYYSSTQGRFTSPDEFTGGPDELYDFADDASDNPTFYADLTNPQSLNKYQYTYNDPLNLTDDDGHCPVCVVVVVVVASTLLAPDTVNAPGPNDPTYPSGDGVKSLMANAMFGAATGPLLSKGTRSLLNFAARREATEVVGGAVERAGVKAVQRGSRNPEVAKRAAEGRARHGDLAQKAKAKSGYKSEPSLKDPLTGKTVKPDVVTRGGGPLN